jgi:hypothetical protein
VAVHWAFVEAGIKKRLNAIKIIVKPNFLEMEKYFSFNE